MSDQDAPDVSQIFRDEAIERLDAMEAALLAAESGRADPDAVDALFRHAHTIKGTAGIVGREDISTLAHAVEDVLAGMRDVGAFPPDLVSLLLEAAGAMRALLAGSGGHSAELLGQLRRGAERVRGEDTAPPSPPAPSVPEPGPSSPAAEVPRQPGAQSHVLRVPAKKIDHLLDVVAEIVQYRRRLAHSVATEAGGDTKLADELRSGDRMLDDLKDTAVAMRMLPLTTITGPLPRAVRDMARVAGKEVELVLAGTQTEFDRVVLESLSEPIAHLLRNAVTHGIETPEERERAGKPRLGRIEVSAVPRGSIAEIVVADDGRGVSAEVIEESRRSGALVNTLTRPGFSTAGEVTQASGRGVGLNAVKTQVHALGGSMEIRSEPGAGTEVTVFLPLALSLLDVLLFGRAGAVYGVPQASVQEVVAVSEPLALQGKPMISVHEHSVPLADVAALLAVPAPALPDHAPALVVRVGDRRIAVACDVLVGQQEVAVKSLGPFLAGAEGYLGAAVLGDGRIALLIEPKALAGGLGGVAGTVAEPAGAPARAVAPAAPVQASREPPKILVVEDSFTVRELQRSILESAGYPVVTAHDGRDALAVLKRDPDIELVVTDLEMPEVDGLELIRTIRADEARASLPVVVVTTYGSAEDRRKGIDAGADAYMAKGSFDQQALIATVERLVGR